jgi:hypothetical protein
MIVGTQCTSGRTLDIDSDLDWQWSRKTLLTEFSTESGEMNNIKVVDNFDIFPESIDLPSYDQRIRSYDLCKLGALLEFPVSKTDQATWTNLDFKPTFIGELVEPWIQRS